jgi:hypothetical protein
MSIARNDNGQPLYPVGKNFVNEDTSFIAGDSPIALDVNNTLGRNGNRGYIIVDGSGNISVEISHDGTNYTTLFTMKSGESLDLTGWSVDTIRLTHSGTNSAYRVHVW